MSSSLLAVCETLTLHISNNAEFNRYLLDFLVLLTSENNDSTRYVRDPYLPRFVQLALHPFSHLSSSSDADFYTILTEIMSFFEHLFNYHPAYLDCVAVNFPFETVVPTIIDLEDEQFLRVITQFIAYLSTSTSLNLKTSNGAISLCKFLIKFAGKTSICGYMMIIFGGFTRHSSIFLTHIKSSADLRTFRAILLNTISGDDHLAVVGALAAILLLFPKFDFETARIAAFHAISVAGENYLLLRASSWIIVEISKLVGLTYENFTTLLQTALTSRGNEAFCLFETLNCAMANGKIEGIGKDFKISPLIYFFLSQSYGYVSYSVINFIEQLIDQNEKLFDTIDECKSLCIKALEVASVPTLAVDVDHIESALTVLNYLVASQHCFDQIYNFLEATEEDIFVSFQRNVESNRAYASLNMFLFIATAGQRIPGWTKRLRILVIESQFGALLAHVIEKSTNRRSISNAIRAISIITNFANEADFTNRELLFDSVVSGFAVVNSQYTKQESEENTKMNLQIMKQEDKVIELKGHIEMNALEMESMMINVSKAESRKEEAEKQLAEYKVIYDSRESELANLNDLNNQQLNEINELKEENDNLKKQIETQQNEFNQQLMTNKKIQEELDKLSKVEEERIQLIKQNAELEQKLQSQAEKMKQLQELQTQTNTQAESYKGKLKDLKNSYNEQIQLSQNCLKEKEKIEIEYKNLQEKHDITEKERENDREKYNLLKGKLKEAQGTVEELHHSEIDLQTQVSSYIQKIDDLNHHLDMLNAEKKQWELVVQFVHRVTDENQVPSDQLMSMFNDY